MISLVHMLCKKYQLSRNFLISCVANVKLKKKKTHSQDKPQSAGNNVFATAGFRVPLNYRVQGVFTQANRGDKPSLWPLANAHWPPTTSFASYSKESMAAG